MSFGFKYGLPIDADLVFDVRFLQIPTIELELRNLTGQDQQSMIMSWITLNQRTLPSSP